MNAKYIFLLHIEYLLEANYTEVVNHEISDFCTYKISVSCICKVLCAASMATHCIQAVYRY